MTPRIQNLVVSAPPAFALVAALLWSGQMLAQSPTASDSVGRRRLQPLPALGSAPETGLQFGATMLAVWEPAAITKTRPASLVFSAIRSTKSQTRVSLDADHWSRGNARRLAVNLQWQKFPLPFYGIGDRTPESAKEIFTPRGVEGTITVQQRIAGAWYVTGALRHLDQTITPDTIGVLRLQNLTGVTGITGNTGGRVTEFTGGVLVDTRDNLFAPRHGQWLQLNYARSAKGVRSDFAFGRTRLDARSYYTITGTHVLATQLQVVGLHGDAPFDQLALIGNGDIMRGYPRGRYRDRWMAAAQGEYRTPLSHRVGGVVFAGAGVSAPSLDALGERILLPTYGAGLRLQIDQRQRTSVRADYGRGRESSGLYIGFNQSF